MEHDNQFFGDENKQSKTDETQESFRQNFSFAEKILDPDGIFPPSSDDHDIRKVTREKVEEMLYAQQLKPDMQEMEPSPRLGPHGINQWILENKAQHEIPAGILRDYLRRGLQNSPHVYFKKYKYVRKLLYLVAEYHKILPAQVQNEHLLDPQTLRHAIMHLATCDLTASLFHFLMQHSIEACLLDKHISAAKPSNNESRMHPRILSFKQHLEGNGFSPKHVRNTVFNVHQLLVWLCANVRLFATASPADISIFQVQNDHLLAYRTHSLKLVKEGVYSPITFTHKIYAIRSFYCFLKQHFGYEPPLQRFRAIKAPRYSPRDMPTDQQIEAFFRVVDRYASRPVRDEIGYRLMLHLGLRLSEAAHIKWNDINLGNRSIVIHSKGKKSHVLPLTGKLYQLLREFQQLQTARTYLMGEKPSVTANNLYENFKLYAMIAGWPFPGGVHFFRHIFITRLAFKEILPQALKELARVKRLDTVGLYMHFAQQNDHLISQINLLKYE